MKTWEFEATDPDGVRFVSTVQAESFEDARAQVIAMEMTLVSLERADGGSSHNRGRNHNRVPHNEPAGPRPAGPPRDLSAGDTKALHRGPFFWILFGAIFGGVGLVFNIIAIALILSGNWAGAFMLFTLIHTVIGGFALRKGLRERSLAVDVAANGVSAIGRIIDIRLKRNTRVNGRHPTIFEYDFEVDGGRHVGQYQTLDPAAGHFVVGDSVWVLHDPADPSRNIVWPLA